MNEWQMRGKDSSPEDTLKRIQAIYDRLGLKMSVQEFDSGVENCCSCRLTLEGPLGAYIGVNGKGMTRELTLASANGEMMERLSNRMFMARVRFDDDRVEELFPSFYPLYSPAGEEQPACIRMLKEKVASTVRTPLFMQTPLELTESLLEQLSPDKYAGKYPTLPFYNPGRKEPVYLPFTILSMFTGSNGMAAGNTYEEAIVEGLSEIFERYAQMLISDGTVTPPELPDSVIDAYPHIRRVISQITKDPRYEVRVLDCSLGTKLPVVCGVILDRKTGRFGMKYGSQPNMGIALERVFTESMQGSTLELHTRRNTPDFHALDPSRRIDKWNSMKVGTGKVTARLLMDRQDYSFVPWESTEGKTNRQVMQSMFALCRELGSDIYVHDASYLGFPAVYIYVPGLADVQPVDVIQLKTAVLGKKVQHSFLHLESATTEEVRDIALFAQLKTGAMLENTVSAISGLCCPKPMPGTPFEAEFLLAACLYQLGDISRAGELLHTIAARSAVMDPDTAGFVSASDVYVDGVSSDTDEEQVFAVVKRLYPDYADKVRDAFLDKTKTLARLYPSGKGKLPTQMDREESLYPAIHDFYAMLVREEELHTPDPATIIQVLTE